MASGSDSRPVGDIGPTRLHHPVSSVGPPRARVVGTDLTGPLGPKRASTTGRRSVRDTGSSGTGTRDRPAAYWVDEAW